MGVWIICPKPVREEVRHFKEYVLNIREKDGAILLEVPKGVVGIIASFLNQKGYGVKIRRSP